MGFKWFRVFVFLFSFWVPTVFGKETSPPIPTRLPFDKDILVISDTHGSFDVVYSMLRDRNYVDDKGHLIKKNILIIFMGDHTDKGHFGIAMNLFAKRLEEEAPALQSQVISIMGNHDLGYTQGKFSHMHELDFKLHKEFYPDLNLDQIYDQTDLRSWMEQRPAMVIVGNFLFAHGFVDMWALQHTPEEINQALRQHIIFWRTKNPKDKPPLAMNFVADKNLKSPLFIRPESDGNYYPVPLKILERIMHHLGVDYIIVGHTTTKSHEIELKHAMYGHRVIKTDSTIYNSKYVPRLMVIRHPNQNFSPMAFDRLELLQRHQKGCKLALESLKPSTAPIQNKFLASNQIILPTDFEIR